jgi:hypothetical protein
MRIDGDRHPDLIAAPGQLFLSRGTARFVPLDPAALGAVVKATQLGDLTGDGDPDVLERIDSGILAYRTRVNDGIGSFLPRATTLVRPSTPLAMHEALGDLDGDGDVDVLGNFGGPDRGLVFLPNQGNGVFGAPRPAPYTRSGVPLAVYLDDLDRDGDLDALDVSTEGLVVARNDGTGGFPAGNLVWAGFPASADHADFDGDGDRDVLVARDTLTLLENRRGNFVDVTAQYFATPPSGFGRPLVVNAASTTWLLWPRIGVVDVYERVGATFVARPPLGLGYAGEALAARRLPAAPGIARVHVQRRVGSAVLATILEFDGRSLRDVTTEVLPNAEVELVGAADLDVDGDTDFVTIDATLHTAALQGQTRALRTRYTPFVGGSVELALRDTTASWPNQVQAVGLVGLIARQPLAGIGMLRIDPRAAVVLPPLPVFVPTELGVSIPVPADPALRDVEFGVQFAHVDAAARIALGPLARVIVR